MLPYVRGVDMERSTAITHDRSIGARAIPPLDRRREITGRRGGIGIVK